MSHYKLVNNTDGNDYQELCSTSYDDACKEALDDLGHHVVIDKGDKDEKSD